MKLVLRRDQKAAMLGKTIFGLDVRAQLEPDEKAAVQKYKLGSTVLYEKKPLKDGGGEMASLGHALSWRFLNMLITVDDLDRGKRIECKDIVEVLAAEEQVKEAAGTFKTILDACRHFEGEEIVEL